MFHEKWRVPLYTFRPVLLKPQDLLVALKLAVNRTREFTISSLADELGLALSVVHGCVSRAAYARLITRTTGSPRAVGAAVREFVIHGAKYAFPVELGAATRGVATAIAAPVLARHFEKVELPPVWPDPEANNWGPAVTPLHGAAVFASKQDPQMYDALALLDAIRVGAAREREIAARELEVRLA